MEVAEEVLQKARLALGDDCVAIACVDRVAGEVRDYTSIDTFASCVLDVVAHALQKLDRPAALMAVEKELGDGEPAEGELLVFSEHLLHIFVPSSKPPYAFVFVCRKHANVGLVMAKSRVILPGLEHELQQRKRTT